MKKRLLIACVIVLLGVAAAVWGAPWLKTQIEIDRCLDRGGRWDYGVEGCVVAEEMVGGRRNAA